MVAMKFRRDLDAEVAKFFKGTPDERVARALRLGRRGVDVFLASLPPGTSRAVAAEMLAARKRSARRPSAALGATRA
jgi:hypothetical protein